MQYWHLPIHSTGESKIFIQVEAHKVTFAFAYHVTHYYYYADTIR